MLVVVIRARACGRALAHQGALSLTCVLEVVGSLCQCPLAFFCGRGRH